MDCDAEISAESEPHFAEIGVEVEQPLALGGRHLGDRGIPVFDETRAQKMLFKGDQAHPNLRAFKSPITEVCQMSAWVAYLECGPGYFALSDLAA